MHANSNVLSSAAIAVLFQGLIHNKHARSLGFKFLCNPVLLKTLLYNMARDHVCGMLYSKFYGSGLLAHRIFGDPVARRIMERHRFTNSFNGSPVRIPCVATCAPWCEQGIYRFHTAGTYGLPRNLKDFPETVRISVYLRNASPDPFPGSTSDCETARIPKVIHRFPCGSHGSPHVNQTLKRDS